MNPNATDYTLDFVLPAGPTGPTGDTGDQGPQGEKGDQGIAGPAGPAPTISIGTVTTGAPGTDASVTIKTA